MFWKYCGDDSGIVKIGLRWWYFPCLHCAKLQHPEGFKERYQGQPTQSMKTALDRRKRVIACNKENHKIGG